MRALPVVIALTFLLGMSVSSASGSEVPQNTGVSLNKTKLPPSSKCVKLLGSFQLSAATQSACVTRNPVTVKEEHWRESAFCLKQGAQAERIVGADIRRLRALDKRAGKRLKRLWKRHRKAVRLLARAETRYRLKPGKRALEIRYRKAARRSVRIDEKMRVLERHHIKVAQEGSSRMVATVLIVYADGCLEASTFTKARKLFDLKSGSLNRRMNEVLENMRKQGLTSSLEVR